ncbi:MAG: gamma-glutamyltransferase [Planctomycetaceae bacterium]
MPGDVGFVLQNRGALFSLDESHPNRLEPHKRPFHTIIPAMATKDGEPWLVFGVMGGDMQPQGHVQVLVNMIDFGMDVQSASDAARVRHVGSAQPTGVPMQEGGGRVIVETGVTEEVIELLKQRGHIVEEKDVDGGYQGIMFNREYGTLSGGTEPRKDGAAVRMLSDGQHHMPDTPPSVTLDDIHDAASRMAQHVHRTPVMSSRLVDEWLGCRVVFKCVKTSSRRSLQVRGACNAVMSLTDARALAEWSRIPPVIMEQHWRKPHVFETSRLMWSCHPMHHP